jgi:hypothetical protein
VISTYYNAKGEVSIWHVKFTLKMCLGIAPGIIATQHTFNAPAFTQVGGTTFHCDANYILISYLNPSRAPLLDLVAKYTDPVNLSSA